MPTDAKLGILVPGMFGGTPPTLGEFSGFFRRAEELGYDSLWVIDRVFHPVNIIDPMALLTVAATVTERVRLGTAVLLFVLRNPILVAKSTATLDYLSGGRLTLGISLGGRDNEFDPLGVDVRQRVSRFNEGLEVMRRLWSERDVTHHGRYFSLDSVNVDPKPVQQPSIPVIIGGSADSALQRAAEHTDGWVAGGAATPEVFATAWGKVRDYAAAAGKDPGTLQSAKLIYTYVDTDRDRAKRALEEFTHAYYGPQYDVENVCAFGRPEDCAEKLQAYIDAGAQTVMVGPTWPDPAQIERISAEVAPLLR
jgi:probable F420-dependent oxidoreductase